MDWINHNPTINEDEKQNMLEFSKNFEAKMKRTAEAFIILSDKSLTKISTYFKEKFDITISRDTFGRFAKKILREKEYLKRFPIDQEKVTQDIEIVIKDMIQNTPLSQRQIAERLKELEIPVSRKVVRTIIKKVLNQKEIEKKYPAHLRYTAAQEKAIQSAIQDTNLSQTEIARNLTNDLRVQVSRSKIGRFSKIKFPEEHNKRFDTPHQYTEYEEMSIWDKIQNKNWSQVKIAKALSEEWGFTVSRMKVRNIALERLSQEKYEIRFPQNEVIYTEAQEAKIWEAIQNPNQSLSGIALTGIASFPKVRQIAKEKLSPEEYKDRFIANQDKYPEDLDALMRDAIWNASLSQIEIAKNLSEETGIKISTWKVWDFAQKELSPEELQERFPIDFYIKVGTVMHPVLEKYLKTSLQNEGITVLCEDKLNNNRIHDNIIVVNERFRKIFNKIIPPEIKYISIDYSLDTSQEKFEEKCKKGYHSQSTLFYFVPISYYKKESDYKIPSELELNKNTHVLPLEDFINSLIVKKDNQDILRKFINKVLEVKRTKDDEGLKRLMKISESLNQLIGGQKVITDF